MNLNHRNGINQTGKIDRISKEQKSKKRSIQRCRGVGRGPNPCFASIRPHAGGMIFGKKFRHALVNRKTAKSGVKILGTQHATDQEPKFS